MAYKNQHYIPQFYLKHFTKDNVGLIRYDIEKKKPERRNIESTCALFYFYADKENSATFERMMSGLEVIYSRIIDKIIDKLDLNQLTMEDHIFLCNFILLSATRTESSKKESEILANAVFDVMKPGLATNPEFIEKGITEEGLNDVRLVKDRANFEGMLIAMLGPYLISDLSVALLVNKSCRPFITSDNPVVFYNLIKAGEMGMRGFQSPGLIILMPISKDITICLYDPMVNKTKTNSRGCVNITKSNDANRLNRLQIANAERYLLYSEGGLSTYVNELIETMELDDRRINTIKWSEDDVDGENHELYKFSRPAPRYAARFSFIEVDQYWLRAYSKVAERMGKGQAYAFFRNKEMNRHFEDEYKQVMESARAKMKKSQG